MIRVVADKQRCQGYASCVITDPDVFDLGDDGKVQVVVEDIEVNDTLEDAVNACPMKALMLLEEE